MKRQAKRTREREQWVKKRVILNWCIRTAVTCVQFLWTIWLYVCKYKDRISFVFVVAVDFVVVVVVVVAAVAATVVVVIRLMCVYLRNRQPSRLHNHLHSQSRSDKWLESRIEFDDFCYRPNTTRRIRYRKKEKYWYEEKKTHKENSVHKEANVSDASTIE